MSKRSIVSIALTQVILDNIKLKDADSLQKAMVNALNVYPSGLYDFPDKPITEFADYIENNKFSIFIFANFLLARFDEMLKYTKTSKKRLAIENLIYHINKIIEYEDTEEEYNNLEQATKINDYFEQLIK